MSNPSSLLPPNATTIEQALEQTTARIDDIPVPLRDLWNPATCPAQLLPWLAWALNTDNWDSTWPESVKRSVIQQSASIHRLKGTVAAIRLALSGAGFEEVEIVEGALPNRHNGDISFDGTHTYGGDDHWATYRIYLKKPISATQAEQIRSMLSVVQPLRTHLAGIYYVNALYFYDKQHTYDGTASYGGS